MFADLKQYSAYKVSSLGGSGPEAEAVVRVGFTGKLVVITAYLS